MLSGIYWIGRKNTYWPTTLVTSDVNVAECTEPFSCKLTASISVGSKKGYQSYRPRWPKRVRQVILTGERNIFESFFVSMRWQSWGLNKQCHAAQSSARNRKNDKYCPIWNCVINSVWNCVLITLLFKGNMSSKIVPWKNFKRNKRASRFVWEQIQKSRYGIQYPTFSTFTEGARNLARRKETTKNTCILLVFVTHSNLFNLVNSRELSSRN